MNDVKKIPAFDINKLEEYETITPRALEIMENLKNGVFIIENFWDIETYDKFILSILKNMSFGFEHRDFRYYPIQFKFTKDEKEEVKSLPYQHFIFNTMMWRPQICLEPQKLGSSHIIRSSEMSRVNPIFIKNYMDEMYIEEYNRFIPTMPHLSITEINPELNLIFADTNFMLTRISANFSKFIGISSSLEIFMDLAERIPEFDKMIHYTLDETQQPADIEQERDNLVKDIISLITKQEDFNLLKPLMQPKSGLNTKQYGELAANICMKPDDMGNTIPYVINKNYLTGSLENPMEYYLVAIAGRKAQVINNEYMGKTGHLLNQVAIMCMNVKLSKTVMDCHTVNPIPFTIESDTHLKKLDGRRYRYAGEKKYKTIKYKKDKHLIGETVYVRSPITCAAHDGVCCECYGELFYTNIDNYATGTFSATTVMNPVVQGILSAKHHQTTNSSKIVFQPEFNQFFEISSTDIILKSEIEDIMDYSLVIRREYVTTEDEEENIFVKKKRRKKKKAVDKTSDVEDFAFLDYESKESEDDDCFELGVTPYSTTRFEVVKYRKVKGKEPIRIELYDAEFKELFIHHDFVDRMIPDSDEIGQYLYIPLEDINQEEFVFLMDVENNELTRPMKMIQNALNNKAHAGCSDYESLANKMLDLMIQSKLDAMSVHAEVIIRELVRSSRNVLKRPDFTRLVMLQDYQLMTIMSALKKNPAINTSLSTAYLKDQLIRQTETYEKWEKSEFDSYFRLTLKD